MARSVTDQLKERLKPTPFSELSGLRKLRRAFGFLLAISAGAMAVSASTADSDWDIRADGSKGAKEAIEAKQAEHSDDSDDSDDSAKSDSKEAKA